MKQSKLNLPIVYLDMDGVIADMDRGMFNLYGINTSRLEEHLVSKSQLFNEYLPDYVKQNMFEDQKTVINSKLLVASLNDLKEQGLINIAILTSTGYFYRPISTVRDQKSRFIEKHFPSLIDVPFCTTTSGRDKAILAHDKAFLIDDHYKNIDNFKSANGYGFVYLPEDDEIVKKTIESVKEFLASH